MFWVVFAYSLLVLFLAWRLRIALEDVANIRAANFYLRQEIRHLLAQQSTKRIVSHTIPREYEESGELL